MAKPRGNPQGKVRQPRRIRRKTMQDERTRVDKAVDTECFVSRQPQMTKGRKMGPGSDERNDQVAAIFRKRVTKKETQVADTLISSLSFVPAHERRCGARVGKAEQEREFILGRSTSDAQRRTHGKMFRMQVLRGNSRLVLCLITLDHTMDRCECRSREHEVNRQ
jgi:hypothetical protein